MQAVSSKHGKKPASTHGEYQTVLETSNTNVPKGQYMYSSSVPLSSSLPPIHVVVADSKENEDVAIKVFDHKIFSKILTVYIDIR